MSNKSRKITAALLLVAGVGIVAFSVAQRVLVSALVGMAEAFGTTAEVSPDIINVIAPYAGVALLLAAFALFMHPRWWRRPRH